jgi:hypothetical protein
VAGARAGHRVTNTLRQRKSGAPRISGQVQVPRRNSPLTGRYGSELVASSPEVNHTAWLQISRLIGKIISHSRIGALPIDHPVRPVIGRQDVYALAGKLMLSKNSSTPGTGLEKSMKGGKISARLRLNHTSNSRVDAANFRLPSTGSVPSR